MILPYKKEAFFTKSKLDKILNVEEDFNFALTSSITTHKSGIHLQADVLYRLKIIPNRPEVMTGIVIRGNNGTTEEFEIKNGKKVLLMGYNDTYITVSLLDLAQKNVSYVMKIEKVNELISEDEKHTFKLLGIVSLTSCSFLVICILVICVLCCKLRPSRENYQNNIKRTFDTKDVHQKRGEKSKEIQHDPEHSSLIKYPVMKENLDTQRSVESIDFKQKEESQFENSHRRTKIRTKCAEIQTDADFQNLADIQLDFYEDYPYLQDFIE